ncbi:ABC transporter ATP-binding protein/permease [Oceanospirillaceae bacterium]|nr:ABC transporter ATP-binding protein/permease [Oceanospirillaceae bacterium]
MLDLIGLSLIAPYAALVVQPETITDGAYQNIIETVGLPLEMEPLLLILGFGLLSVFLIKMVCAIFINRTIIKFSQEQQVRLRSFLMQAYQNMPYTDYLQRNSSEYIYSVQTLTSQYATGVILVCLRTLSDGVIMLMILLMLAWINGVVLLVLVILLTGMVLGYDRFFRKHLHSYGKKANSAAAKMIQGINEGVGGLKEIRILNKEKYFYNMVRQGAKTYANNNVKSQVISTAPRYLLEFLMIFFVVLLVVGTIVLGGDLSELVPTLAVFGVAAMRLLPSVNVFSNSLVKLRFNRHAVTLLYKDVLLLQQIIQEPKSSMQGLFDKEKFKELELKHIIFQYPTSNQLAINDVSLKIRAGESIGIIGPSGSGKTTMVDILLGLLEPQDGELLYNGQLMKEDLASWRSHVAYLPQEIFLIDNTLRKNVALGQDDDEIEESRIFKSLEQACLTELVEQLPHGIDTILGERGVRLSGGQRQRIALARAFYYGRSVLVMDEATSALDSETEKEIIAEIQRYKDDKTLIVIAHRLTTIQHCDRIICLSNGTIDNIGTPEKILNL